MKNDIDAKLKPIVIKLADNLIKSEDINDDSHLISDFGYDSIQTIQLVVEIEKKFKMEFDDEDLTNETFVTYGSLKKTLAKKLKIK